LTDLHSLGWNIFFEENFLHYKNSGLTAARVIVENKTNYLLLTQYGEALGEATGKLLFNSNSQTELPKVGDWVAVQLFDENTKAVIHNVLPRKTKISRKAADKKTEEQVIAANIDKVFIVQGLDGNYNINRLERMLVAVYQSGAEPVVVLNKSDLCVNINDKINEIKISHPELVIFSTSAVDLSGIQPLANNIGKAETIAFVGSSGVGKSSLINALLGEERIKTGSVRESDSRGRHTTTKRELFLLNGGGILIDTPGMREFGLWNSDAGLSQTFSEFDELSAKCKYADCSHTHEKDCAVIAAVEDGTLPREKYDNYLKLRKELKYLETKQDIFAALEEKRKWKNIHKEAKRLQNRGYKR
jgi:ribosome biogenesis GTPase / thiamine phosphate phosphatase